MGILVYIHMCTPKFLIVCLLLKHRVLYCRINLYQNESCLTWTNDNYRVYTYIKKI